MTETPDAATVPRETGQEKAPSTCANCGAEVGVVETPYGSTAPGTCTKCYPAQDPANTRQQAGAQSTPRELGTQPSGSTGSVTDTTGGPSA